MRLPVKKKQKTGNEHALPVSQMSQNYVQDSREFYSLAVDIKDGPIAERSFQPVG